MLPAKFGFIWPNSFRGEDFFNISQSETRIALGGHIIAVLSGLNGISHSFLAHLTQRVM
jgi:hypothetical protein